MRDPQEEMAVCVHHTPITLFWLPPKLPWPRATCGSNRQQVIMRAIFVLHRWVHQLQPGEWNREWLWAWRTRPTCCLFSKLSKRDFLAMLRIRTSWGQPNHIGNAEICTLGSFRGALTTADRAASAAFALCQAQLQQTHATPASKTDWERRCFLCASDSINDTFQDIQHWEIGTRSPVQLFPIKTSETWNNQIIPRVSRTSYYGYAEYLAMGSCSAASGCCSLYVSPGKDYSLTSAGRKGVALQMALLSSTQPAPHSHEQPSRNRAGKTSWIFFFFLKSELW